MTVTIDQIQKKTEKLKQFAGDGKHEEAAGFEVKLRLDVLKAIAAGKVADPAGVAAEVLKTSKIRFVRRGA